MQAKRRMPEVIIHNAAKISACEKCQEAEAGAALERLQAMQARRRMPDGIILNNEKISAC